MRRMLLLPLMLMAAVMPIVESQAQQPRPLRKVALLVGPSTYLHDFGKLPHLDDDVLRWRRNCGRRRSSTRWWC